MQIIRSKRKTYTLIITAEGELVVRAPLRATKAQIEELLRQKAGWIQEKQELAKQRAAQFAPREFKEGELFWFQGKQYPLKIDNKERPALSFSGKAFHLAKKAQPKAAALFERWYKMQAGAAITARVLIAASVYGYQPGQIRISSARTRWGSCSSKGTLSFTWRLVMAPPEVVDYVIVHELAHLDIHNHSADFWALVGKMMPDYKPRLKWLKENGRLMEIK